MGYDTEKQMATEIANAALKSGYRAFIAERGTYGVFTDVEGTRVVSFQSDGLRESISGNYKTSAPRQTGTGWQIADEFQSADIDSYFNQSAPQWATGGATWRYTTLKEHLKTYGTSSRYREVSIDHSEPTYENQIWHAERLLEEQGWQALDNPHAMIGRECGCGNCFCCAAADVLENYDPSPIERDHTSHPLGY